MIRKTREWLSIHLTKNTGAVLLLGILVMNLVFIALSSLLISSFHLHGTEKMSFLQAAFCTITMIMDAGCIQFVIDDIGQPQVMTAILCLVIIFIGMIIFTGALIGYITNYISRFIDNVNDGSHKLHISNHTVILNWNTRASEIINDFLYQQNRKQKIVVLVGAQKEEIRKEISERLADTISRERREIRRQANEYRGLKKTAYLLRHRFRANVVFVVREGDVFSTKQLEDISLRRARSVVILGNDLNTSVCKYESRERLEEMEKGNSLTVKTLMQVADITGDQDSNDKQTIIVEITDEWTQDLVNKIIKVKEVENKCHIVPIRVNRTLGQILSQFSLMPELNAVYNELFSNKGEAFYCVPTQQTDAHSFINEHLHTHNSSIPLTIMEIGGENFAFFVASGEQEIRRFGKPDERRVDCAVNPKFNDGIKTVIILGHNSRSKEIMQGFEAFISEWQQDGTQLRITVIDEQKFLEKMNYYREYPFVETFAADIFEKEKISEKIRSIVDNNPTDTSVLILSDDNVIKDNVDANALTNLVYQQDIVQEKMRVEKNFDPESLDVIVEIIDPKHHDVVGHYSKNNVVISNRYISKMITQISEKEELYAFYKDILTYDEVVAESGALESKEIYLKEAGKFFTRLPQTCTAAQLIREVYRQSVDPAVFQKQLNPTLVLGYVRPHEGMTLFAGNQNEIEVSLNSNDKLIVYSLH